MNQARLDASIKPMSKIELIVLVCWLGVILLIGVLANFVWWQLLVLITVSLFMFWLHSLRRIVPLNITQLDDSKANRDYNKNQQRIDWHLLVQPNHRQRQQTQLWQGHLIKVDDFGVMVFLTYQIIEPSNKQQGVAIWQDQVNIEDWRKLKVLCTLK